MAKQYNIPNLPKDYSDASQIEKWMSGIQKLFQSKSDADNKKEIEIEDSINSSACTEDAVKDILNANGSAPIYACRAWVNFDGTGTPTRRGFGNVSGITDHGVGNYTINFTTPMEDANYSVQVCVMNDGEYNNGAYGAKSATSVQVRNMPDYSRAYKDTDVSVAIFR